MPMLPFQPDPHCSQAQGAARNADAADSAARAAHHRGDHARTPAGFPGAPDLARAPAHQRRQPGQVGSAFTCLLILTIIAKTMLERLPALS